MKKVFYCMALLLLCGVGWNAIDARASKVPAPDDKVYTWSMDEPLITNVLNDGTGQIVSNAQSGGDESPGDDSNYENLIDDNIETLFHSAWSTDFAADEAPKTGTGYHNLQVRLEEPVDVFFFRYIGRNNDTYHDNPTDIAIYATNNDELGASPKYDVSPNEKWEFITELKEGFPVNSAGLYTSPAIVMNGAYKYVRFVVKNTNTCNTVSWRVFNYPDITGITFNLSEFQMYPGHEVTEPSQLLQVLYDRIKDAGLSVVAGTDPGFYPEDKAKAFHTAFDKADKALQTGSGDMQAIYNELSKAYEDIQGALIPMTSGYYNFISAYAGFEEQQGVRMCLQAATQNTLRWRVYNEKDAYSLFKVTELGDGTFTVQSIATQEYLSTTPGTASVQKTAVESTPQIFTSVGTQQWLISNTENPLGYTVDGVSGGVAKSGNIVTWTGGVNTTSSWYVHKITDESLIKEIEAAAESQMAADMLNDIVTSSKATRELANDYVVLLKNADQISGNSSDLAQGGPYGNLLDGDINTCIHTEWKAEWASPQIEGKGWHNLQFDLKTQVSKIKFNYIGRNNTGGWTDTPNYISIYGTNDDELAKSTAAADSTMWTLITDLTKSNTNFPPNEAAAKFESDVIDLGADYRYLRFVVKNTTTMDGGNRSTSFASPSVTGVTFNLSEMQIYNGIPARTSEYYTVEGMKEACDTYDALVKEAVEKIANLTATTADITALEAAVEKIKELYVDRTVVKEEMVKALNEANTLYNDVVSYKMITNASNNEAGQIKVNSTNGYDLNNLINGDSDGDDIFHSQWTTSEEASMQDKNLTEEVWKDYNEKNGGTGVGYHNVQFRLNIPESKFNFLFITRNSGNWADTPNYLKILATNDDALGASTDNADEAKWDEIMTMADKAYYKDLYNRELPDNVKDVKFPSRGAAHVTWSSPEIDLGKDYKYIRFVILGTNNADLDGQDRGINRSFSCPDITGITWNLMEFQLYGLGAAAQVNSVPGMKEAVEKLKAILDVDNALDETAYNQQIVDELQAALEQVKTLYVDRAKLASKMDTLVRKGRKLYSSVVGSRLIYKGEQMSTNSSQPSQGGPLTNLIDDNYNTVFHSIWYNSNDDGTDFGMKSANITVSEWEDLMNENPTAYPHTGTGYHNLQVQFEHPVSKFFFEYTGRNNATWSDSPTQVAIFATNDDQLGASTDNADQDLWDNITELNEGAKANSALAYFRSADIDLGKEYKYVRLVIKRTTNSSRPESEADRINRLFRSPEVTGITWNASEFQMYELGDRAQVNYVDGMKDAADKLYQEIAATENLSDQQLTMTIYLGLKNAVDNVLALYADNSKLRNKLLEIENELANAEVEPTKIGYAPNQGVIDDLQAVYDQVADVVIDKPTKTEIDGLIETLETAYKTYLSKMNTVQPDKWYYITSGAEGYYSDGAAIYVKSTNSGEDICWRGEVSGEPYEGLASAMWRFVPIEGKPGEYAIQNYLTTHYIGAYNGKGNANQPKTSAEAAPYLVKYISKGKVSLISQDEANTEPCGLHAQESEQLVVSWTYDNPGSTWAITEIEDDMASIYVPQNSMQIVTLPFSMEEEGATLADLNADANVVTYSLKNLTIDEEGKTTVELTRKNTFKAGEPFIMTVGDYEAYDSSVGDMAQIVLYRQNDIVTEALTANGLIGTFDEIALNKKRMGYATYDGIHLTTNNTVINGLSGYINPTLIEAQEGETDLQLVINGKIDAIKSVEAVKGANVNVYTVDGKLVKRNVNSSDATKGLKKGLYIIGKKKVAVK